ncbi:hypothetical protein PS900_01016 [Pseudomonas fluorescens]|uniref:Uncharacterized protein n=1 Tax=Pseudomonas fluorescens TaxID=294 RepID=A0A8H2NPH6_PSEFL|nr:hypothetical protein PS900_01016 [Pseudomonas fluorescens]
MDMAKKTSRLVFYDHMNSNSKSTRYYYLLTTNLITLRLGKSWNFPR